MCKDPIRVVREGKLVGGEYVKRAQLGDSGSSPRISWYDRIVDGRRELSWASKRIRRTPVVNRRGFGEMRSSEARSRSVEERRCCICEHRISWGPYWAC